MIAVGVISLLYGLAVMTMSGDGDAARSDGLSIGILRHPSLITGPLTIVGGVSMIRKRFRWLAIAGCVTSLLPLSICFGFTFFVPIACLIILNDRQVRREFRT